MKKVFTTILAIIIIVCSFGGCAKRPPALGKEYKNKNYTWNEGSSSWMGVGPDIIDVHLDGCTVENWSGNADCLDSLREAWTVAEGHTRIHPGSIQDKVLFRVIPERKKDIFFIEYDPAEQILRSEEAEIAGCLLDVQDLPSDIEIRTADEKGNYVGGTIVIDDETVTMWKSGHKYATWRCCIEKPEQARILDRSGLYIYDTAKEIIYGLAKTEDGLFMSTTPYVVGVDKAAFGKRSAEITICNVDGELIATDNNGNRRVISSSFSDVKWPFILENGIWHICHCELKLLQGDEKGLPYIKTAIGRDEKDGTAEHFIESWFNKDDTSSWREEYLESLHG